MLDKLSTVGAIDPGESLADRAYEMLQDAILSEELKPGDRLSVSELARQMKISRTPVREAVQRLVYNGLAVHVPYRGVDLVGVGVEDLRQLFEVREVLDGLAAKIACPRVQHNDLHELREILQGHEALLEGDAPSKDHIDCDMRFHARIGALAGNTHLDGMLGSVQGKTHVAIHNLWRVEAVRRLALAEHWRIYHALASGDAVAAEQAARLHVARIQQRLPGSVTGSEMHASQQSGQGPSRRGRPDHGEEYLNLAPAAPDRAADMEPPTETISEVLP